MRQINHEVRDQAIEEVRQGFIEGDRLMREINGGEPFRTSAATVEFITSFAAIYIQTIHLLTAEVDEEEPWE